MAAVAQTGPPHQQPTPMQTDLPQSGRNDIALSWEGDKMCATSVPIVSLADYFFFSLSLDQPSRFNIYIYDYCFKRGFRKTAQELMNEGDLGPDPTPPINARQGL